MNWIACLSANNQTPHVSSLGKGARLLYQALGGAATPRRSSGAEAEPLVGKGHPVTFSAYQVAGGNPYSLECHLPMVMGVRVRVCGRPHMTYPGVSRSTMNMA